MIATHEVRRDGPYLQITLPEVLPPCWGSLIQDVDVELEDGAERAFINIPGAGLGTDDERRLRSFERFLEDQGASVLVRRAYPYAEPFQALGKTSHE
jgi:hypothetical protein